MGPYLIKKYECQFYHSCPNPYSGILVKASPGAVIFRQDILFDILFVADWHKIGGCRQSLTDRGNQRENATRIDYDYKVEDKILVIKEGILCKAESNYGKETWTITTVHTDGTIRNHLRTRTEDLVSREFNHLQMMFYKLKANMSGP